MTYFRRPHRWLRITLTVLLLLAAPYAGWRGWMRYCVVRALDQIRSEGLPATVAEFEEMHARPIPAINAADLYLQACLSLKDCEEPLAQDVPFLGEAQLPPLGVILSDRMRYAIGEYLTQNKETIRLLHEGSMISECVFDISAPEFVNFYRKFSEVLHLLDLEAILQVEEKRFTQALATCRAKLALIRSMNEIPFGIYQTVRMVGQELTVDLGERLLNSSGSDDLMLTELKRFGRDSYDENAVHNAIIYERCHVSDAFSGSAVDYSKILSKSGPYLLAIWTIRLAKITGQWDQCHVDFLSLLREYEKSYQVPFPDRLRNFNALRLRHQDMSAKWLRVPATNPAAWYLPSGLSSQVSHEASVLARMNALDTSLALERYRNARHLLPERLEDLQPTFMDHIPLDPFTGRPLLYRRLDPGYIVYSVGRNGRDDGGREDDDADPPLDDVGFTVRR